MGCTFYNNVKAKSISYGSVRKASAIKYIVIHYTGNNTDTAKANATYYKNTNTRTAGSHYFVDATSVYQSIDDLRPAWAVGGSKYSDCAATGGGALYKTVTNANSISVEMCSTKGAISAGTFANTVALTKALMAKYNIPASRVVRHFDVNGKHCPGYSSWMGKNPTEWVNFKNQLTASNYVHNKVDYAPVFDATFYANKYSDLKNAFGSNATKLFEHFCKYGMAEGRQACATFDATVYKASNQDLRAAFGSNLPKYYEHYCVYGFKENRKCV